MDSGRRCMHGWGIIIRNGIRHTFFFNRINFIKLYRLLPPKVISPSI